MIVFKIRESRERDERDFGREHHGPCGHFGRGFGGRRHEHRHGPRRAHVRRRRHKAVILKLLSEQPSYGYQLIKTMEERLAGGYTPSAGVIPDAHHAGEEEGLATSNLENNKKVYSVTADGKQFLEENKRRVEALFERLAQAGQGFERGRSPEIMKAFQSLRGAVISRVSREKASARSRSPRSPRPSMRGKADRRAVNKSGRRLSPSAQTHQRRARSERRGGLCVSCSLRRLQR